MACLEKDLEECLAHLKLPPAHHRATHTTNFLERLFEDGRRRTNALGHFPSEGACKRLVFATMVAVSQGWRGVHMTPDIQVELHRLRQFLAHPRAERRVTHDPVQPRERPETTHATHAAD